MKKKIYGRKVGSKFAHLRSITWQFGFRHTREVVQKRGSIAANSFGKIDLVK